VELVKKLDPTMFVMENVKGILTILHDKPILTPSEKVLADKYYALEVEKLKLEMEKKRITTEKRKHGKNASNSYSVEIYTINKENIKLVKKTRGNEKGYWEI